uniref:EF-hand domain-containing protein n=1 Tax=Zooxanthella nutricula TaxID=1333877 RepID=A0A7S2LRT0_9DINO
MRRAAAGHVPGVATGARRASVYVPSSMGQLGDQFGIKQEMMMRRGSSESVSSYRDAAPVRDLFQNVRGDFEKAYALNRSSEEDGGTDIDILELQEDQLGELDITRLRCKAIVSGCMFQTLVTLAIALNAAIIGLETDDPDNPWWDKVEFSLTFFFTGEISIRLFVHGADFFDSSSTDFVWNVFDFVVVTIGILDTFCKTLLGDAMGSGNIAMIVRGIRLSRILRIFRLVRFARRLYVLAYGFSLAAVSVFWVTFLMSSVLYICAIVLVRSLGHAPNDDPDQEFFRDHFGTVMRAMFTLFQLSVQPQMMEYHHLLNERPFLIVFLVFFIIFGSFGMIALLTGVISEAMFEKNILRSEEERSERDAMFKTVAKACASIFDSTYTQDGEATREDLVNVLPKVARVFEDNGLPYTKHDLVCMLELMDTDASGSIDRTEFCRGILQIVEDVRPMLIMELHYDSITYFKNRIDKCDYDMRDLMADQAALYDEVKELGVIAGASDPQERPRRNSDMKPALTSIGESEEASEGESPPAGLPLDTALDPSLEALVSGLQRDVSDLRGSCSGLESRLKEITDGAAAQLEAERLQDDVAAQRGSMDLDIVAGVAKRVGECEFAVRQLCGAIAGVALQSSELSKGLQALEDYHKHALQQR